MNECENSHTFCDHHITASTKEIVEKYLKREIEDGEDIDELYGECDDLRYDFLEECCPICQLNKIKDGTILKYLYKKFKIEKSDIENEIREKFKSLKEVEQFVK